MPLGTASCKAHGGRALEECGGVKSYQVPSNSECREPAHGSETACDKVRSREGNSPDRRPRSRNEAECKMMCGCADSQEVGSEAAIP